MQRNRRDISSLIIYDEQLSQSEGRRRQVSSCRGWIARRETPSQAEHPGRAHGVCDGFSPKKVGMTGGRRFDWALAPRRQPVAELRGGTSREMAEGGRSSQRTTACRPMSGVVGAAVSLPLASTCRCGGKRPRPANASRRPGEECRSARPSSYSFTSSRFGLGFSIFLRAS
jgi:hypothetical protein